MSTKNLLSIKKSFAFPFLQVFFLLGFSFFLSSCVMTRNDLKEVEQKKVIQDQMLNLQKSTADQVSRFEEIDQDFRHLNGRLDVLEKQNNQFQLDRDKAKKKTDDDILEVNKRVSILQEEISKLDTGLNALITEVQSMKQVLLNQAAQAQASNISETKMTKEEKASTAFENAEDLFEKKDWKKAILAYQKFRDNHPKNSKYPLASYKIGVCFQELEMKDEAKTFYEEVIAKFPKSAEARKSHTRLKSLKNKKEKN